MKVCRLTRDEREQGKAMIQSLYSAGITKRQIMLSTGLHFSVLKKIESGDDVMRSVWMCLMLWGQYESGVFNNQGK